MTHGRRFTSEKIGKRLKLVERMVMRASIPIEKFRYRRLPDADTDPPLGCDPSGWSEIEWNSYWEGQNQNYLMASSFTIPKGWAHQPIALHLPMGRAGDIFTHPESLLYIDGVPFASADRYHHTIYLPDELADGRPHRIELHGWTGLTGWPPDPTKVNRLLMKPCWVVEIDIPTRDFLSRAQVAHEVAKELDDTRPEKYHILNALDAAFLELDTRDPLGDMFYRSVGPAMAKLEAGLAQAGEPMDVTLHAIGHAHMDIAYLWPVSQIRRKNARTYSNVLRLMERFPGYRFSHSQPLLYEYTERDYPEVFEGIKARVAEGRWEVMGGMWVEPDTNIPGGEALVRQLLLGRRYFQETFGMDVETPVLWLPDVFGLSWCLPQLLNQAGIRWMVSNKFSWNQYNKIGASTLWWEGIDGSRVLTQFLTTPRDVQHLPFPTNYKSDLTAQEVIGTWTESTPKEFIADLPICYGYGDGGGGPTGELIRRAKAYQDMPGAPRVKFSSVREFFEAIKPEAHNMVVWADELYFEGHRGVLTSQGWIKRANRRAEWLMHEAEFLVARACVTGDAPDVAERLTEAWKLLAKNQFHDILPGTSVTEVFDDARQDYAQISDLAESIRKDALGPECNTPYLLSALPFPATRQVIAPEDAVTDGPTQKVDNGTLVQMNDTAPYTLSPLRADPPKGALRAELTASGAVLENDMLRVEFDAEANLTRIWDKEAGREVLEPGETGNRLQVFEDRPLSWDAWDIDAFFEDRGERVTGLTRFDLTETGPLRAAIRIERDYRSSRIVQDVRLRADSRRLDFVSKVDWHETHLLLKVAFPVQVLSPVATYEIQWGSIQRPTHRNTLWDFAKFEVCAHKWADLSEGGYGVALMNDCKYGYDIRENVMRLSLIKSATMPDPKADQGEHLFTYSLYPHMGDWRNEVHLAAYELNAPVRFVEGPSGIGARAPLVQSLSPNAIVETVKPAEDGRGIIVRLFEAHRRRGPVKLRFGASPSAACQTSILEQDGDEVAVAEDEISVDLRPFEIVSIRVRFD